MKSTLLIFAGTTEGRRLARFLSQQKVPAHICVATAYGKSLLDEEQDIHTVHAGRLDAEGMRGLMSGNGIRLVVDATHPYAVEVTENIKKAAGEAKARYVRLLREETGSGEDCIAVASVQEAVDYLKEHEDGSVLAATGSRELHLYTQIPGYRERVFARVLSTAESVQAAAALGFEGKNLICMQGPFSEELNAAMLRSTGAAYLVTKESGKTGGFPEKVRAARRAGAKLIVVGRPAREEGCSFEQVLDILRDEGLISRETVPSQGYKEEQKDRTRQIALVGIGMGSPRGMTVEARELIGSADALIGAERMLECAAQVNPHAARLDAYKADEIADWISDHPQYGNVAIVLSGDIGFYSGAKKLTDRLERDGRLHVRVCCGISSVVYLCGKLHTAWEDVRLVSLHGRSQNIVSAVASSPKVFVLAGKQETFTRMCRTLTEYGLGDVRVSVGSNLSYENETIITGSAEKAAAFEPGDLCAALITNPRAGRVVTHGIEDEAFIRGKVPMTKKEVRSISLSALELRADSVVYDIGAGTGSVSIEAARMAPEGTVYAIEKKPEAVELIRRNMRHFQVPNIEVIEGTAPQALRDLPSPTHAFLGGTSGNMESILRTVLDKNPHARIVINAIALETVAETLRVLSVLGLENADIACVNVSKSKMAGSYHMMMGQNPVYVIACGGPAARKEA